MMIFDHDTDWMSDGACVDYDVDLWFPAQYENADAAKKICYSCPVRLRCLNHAIAAGEQYGVWGGLTVRERRRVRRVRAQGLRVVA